MKLYFKIKTSNLYSYDHKKKIRTTTVSWFSDFLLHREHGPAHILHTGKKSILYWYLFGDIHKSYVSNNLYI